MRRTITLLLLLLCCVARAGAQDAAGLSSEAEVARRDFVTALKDLKVVAKQRQSIQPDKKVAAAMTKIIEYLEQRFPRDEDFDSEEKLTAAATEVAEWNKAVHETKKIPTGPVAEAITTAFQKSSDYNAAKGRNNPGGDPPPPPPNKPPNVESVANEVKELRTQVAGQAGILPWWASLGLMTLTPLLALGLFAFAFVSIRQTRRDVTDLNNRAHQALLSLRTKHEGLVKTLEGLSASDADLFARLAELSAEIGAVDGRVRGLKAVPAAMTERGDGDGRGMPPPQAEPPAFPISAFAYLRKMQRHATVVKPDFQNGILVADSENKGELVLVQDTSISHDTLFVVPRAAQFQMKQDFYTYYERYYDCERPASGTVWIVDPAVVERVQGGWELREKGVLEVR